MTLIKELESDELNSTRRLESAIGRRGLFALTKKGSAKMRNKIEIIKEAFLPCRFANLRALNPL